MELSYPVGPTLAEIVSKLERRVAALEIAISKKAKK